MTDQPTVDSKLEPIAAATLGGPSELPALRQAVLADVASRQRSFQEYRTNKPLNSALDALALDAFGDAYEAETLRFWLLTVHYTKPLTLEEGGDATQATRYPALDESERRLSHLYATKRRLAELPAERIMPVQTAPKDILAVISDALSEAMENDLDTPRALAESEDFLSAVNALCDTALRKQGHVNVSAVQAAHAGFATLGGLLGLGNDKPVRFLERVRNRGARRQNIDTQLVERKIAERTAARGARDFAKADRLQAELLAQGVSLLDGALGTAWTLA